MSKMLRLGICGNSTTASKTGNLSSDLKVAVNDIDFVIWINVLFLK